jgi:hypothetical protein
MMEYAEEAKNLASETTRKALAADRKLELALTRLVEIIGEGSGKSFYPDPGAISGYSVDRNDRAQKPADPSPLTPYSPATGLRVGNKGQSGFLKNEAAEGDFT